MQRLVTLSDYFSPHGPGKDEDQRMARADETLSRCNFLLVKFLVDYPDIYLPRCRSGFRTEDMNKSMVGASPQSKHMSAEAIDLNDRFRVLARWCVNNLALMERAGVWMEDPRCTPVSVHWQIVPPKNQRRIFVPDHDWSARISDYPLTPESMI